jgi:uncharacterized repeat protein (TIGR03806 family)
VSGAGVTSCICTNGYSGATCEVPPSVCAGQPCSNGGECYDAGGVFGCHCPVAFTGASCESAAPSGLSTRPNNATCTAFAQPTNTGTLRWTNTQVSNPSGLSLMMMRQSTAGYWFEAYRTGQVYVRNPDGVRSVSPIFTVSTTTAGEMGLLGLALHPNFDSVPYLYVYYTNLGGVGGDVQILIDRYYVSNPTTNPQVDVASRKNVFTFDRGENYTNHIGGSIEFDPVSPTPMLYAALGDGGSGHATCNLPNPAGSANGSCKAQYIVTIQGSTQNYHGKLLRFDVSNTAADATFTPEIVGLGLRNPFRWSFDSENGDLWIGDVGEGEFEEVNHLPRASLPASGATPVNFGWPCFEGFEPFASGNLCPGVTGTLQPIHVYGHDIGVSVIGGRVYRGSAIGGMSGVYFFNDIFPVGQSPPWYLDGANRVDIGTSADPRGFVAYTEDADGELYAMVTWGARYRLSVNTAGAPVTLPQTLSATGCFGPSGVPTGGLIPYDVRAPLWSDGADKKRWLALPEGQSVTVDASGDFVFPVGTVLAKEFTQGGVRVETRLFVRHASGDWAGYTYAWMTAGGVPLADAELVGSASSVRSIPGTALTWQFPSRGQCLSCHTAAAGFSLGLEVGQLNDVMTYPSSGVSANQLHTLETIGVLTSDLSGVLARNALPKYSDTAAPLSARTHAYLHSNCASCHQPGASGFGGRSNMPDLRYNVFGAVELRNLLCGRAATADHLGLGNGALLVTPGNAGSWSALGAGGSVLALRMAARELVVGSRGAMPPIGSVVADAGTGLSLVSSWIETLVCP